MSRSRQRTSTGVRTYKGAAAGIEPAAYESKTTIGGQSCVRPHCPGGGGDPEGGGSEPGGASPPPGGGSDPGEEAQPPADPGEPSGPCSAVVLCPPIVTLGS